MFTQRRYRMSHTSQTILLSCGMTSFTSMSYPNEIGNVRRIFELGSLSRLRALKQTRVIAMSSQLCNSKVLIALRFEFKSRWIWHVVNFIFRDKVRTTGFIFQQPLLNTDSPAPRWPELKFRCGFRFCGFSHFVKLTTYC